MPGTALEEGAFAPVPPAERIATLDILRGFALLGVLWSNLNGDYGAPDWSRIPRFPITLEGSLKEAHRGEPRGADPAKVSYSTLCSEASTLCSEAACYPDMRAAR